MKKLQLESIKWKNLLSYGEQWSEVDFTKNNMTLITGSNGNGKSTFIEATCYALFGKTIRKVSKSSLINTKNQKGLMVVLTLKSNGKDYVIHRGMKPNKFEIYEDGSLLSQNASVRDYQEKLESIIGVDYNTFIQTVIISKTKYVPFMRLDAPSRREFVENLLTLTIFGNMNKKQRVVLSNLKELVQDLSHDFGIAKNNIEQTESSVKSINELLQQNLTEKRDYINERIVKLELKNDELKTEAKKIKDTLFVDDNNTIENYNELKTKVSKMEFRLSDTKKKIYDVTNNTTKICGECGTELSIIHSENHLKDLNTNSEKLTNSIKLGKVEIDRLQETVNLINANVVIENEIRSYIREMKSNIGEIKSLESEKDSLIFDDTVLIKAKQKLSDYREKYAEINIKLVDAKKEFAHNNIVYDMLKDGGIKASIIDKSIPLINSIVNKNLSKFGFFVNFELDSEFNETIKQRGIDTLSYDSFSEGEKLRMDMAVLLAWREVAQLQNNISCNVLLFDEMTDASMDFDGSEILGSMLSELEDTHVFVITHSPEKLQTYANGLLSVSKDGGYSKIS